MKTPFTTSVNVQRLYQGYVNCVNAQVESVTQHLLLKSVLDLATENFMENLQKSLNLLVAASEGIFSIVTIFFCAQSKQSEWPPLKEIINFQKTYILNRRLQGSAIWSLLNIENQFFIYNINFFLHFAALWVLPFETAMPFTLLISSATGHVTLRGWSLRTWFRICNFVRLSPRGALWIIF